MTAAQIDALATRFAAAAIPRAEWTHEAHLIVGAWHVHRFGAEEALPRLRAGIRRLNETNGVANSATDGYHETITAAYVRLLARALTDGAAQMPFEVRLADLLASPLARKSVLLRHYSRAVLMSPGARAEWVAPDKEPLPEP